MNLPRLDGNVQPTATLLPDGTELPRFRFFQGARKTLQTVATETELHKDGNPVVVGTNHESDE